MIAVWCKVAKGIHAVHAAEIHTENDLLRMATQCCQIVDSGSQVNQVLYAPRRAPVPATSPMLSHAPLLQSTSFRPLELHWELQQLAACMTGTAGHSAVASGRR